jgi:hypothetical protein
MPRTTMSTQTETSLEERRKMPALILVCRGEELPLTGPNALPEEEFLRRSGADLKRRVEEARRRLEAEKAK